MGTGVGRAPVASHGREVERRAILTLTFHAAQFARRVGLETFDALRDDGVLVRINPADWWPCDGPDGGRPGARHPQRTAVFKGKWLFDKVGGCRMAVG
jgi:hypothetical protein